MENSPQSRERTVVVLAGGFDQIDFVTTFKARGWRVVLIDWNTAPLAGPFADRHYRESTLDADAVLRVAIQENAAMVATACTDQALLVVAQVSEQLGLPRQFGLEAARRLTNKKWMKSHMSACGIPTAEFMLYSPSNLSCPPCLPFPLVCKPVDSNSSKGVTLVRTPGELGQALELAMRESRTQEVICEAYREGDELSIDALVVDGVAHVLMVSESEKMINGSGAFPIHRSLVPARSVAGRQDDIQSIVGQIAKAFGIVNSPMIVQVIASGKRIDVIEFSARIAGGAKHRLIRSVTGFDVMNAFVDILLGERPEVPEIALTALSGSLHVMQYLYGRRGTVASFEGFDALREEGVIRGYHFTKAVGAEVEGALNSSSRVAAVLVADRDVAGINERLHTVFSRVRVLDGDRRDLVVRPANVALDVPTVSGPV